MDTLTVDRKGRVVIERGLIRIYTDDIDPEIAMLIVDFAKLVSNLANGGGGKIIPFPAAEKTRGGRRNDRAGE